MAEQSKPVTPGNGEPARAEGATFSDALPIHLVDLGKVKGKAIKQLKQGGGKLHQAVIEALEDVAFELGDEAAGKTVLPIVLVVEKKPKRRSPFPIF